jgi:hypothetical protein
MPERQQVWQASLLGLLDHGDRIDPTAGSLPRAV